MPTTETSACWIAITPDGRFAYSGNAASQSITGYAIGRKGELSILTPDGKTASGHAGVTDLSISSNGRWLYARMGDGTVGAWTIERDGSLVEVGAFAGLPRRRRRHRRRLTALAAEPPPDRRPAGARRRASCRVTDRPPRDRTPCRQRHHIRRDRHPADPSVGAAARGRARARARHVRPPRARRRHRARCAAAAPSPSSSSPPSAWIVARFLLARFSRFRVLRTLLFAVAAIGVFAIVVFPELPQRAGRRGVPRAGSATSSPPPAALRTADARSGIDHRATGTVSLYRSDDGRHVVGLEQIDIQPGPDYDVYLVPGHDQQDPGDGIRLDDLRGNQGTQYYEIPAGTTIGDGSWTVLVWCQIFDVPVANATPT